MADLRQQILDTSVKMIEREGVRNLSFREIARKAKVSHQAPYHYFSDHQAILREIARQGFVLLAEEMRSSAERASGNELGALCASGEAYIRFAYNHVGHFRVMFQKSLVGISKKSGPLQAGLDAHQVLLGLAKNAQNSGYGKDLTTEQLTTLCWAAVHGIANLLTDGAMEECSVEKAQELVVGSLKNLLTAAKPAAGGARVPRHRKKDR